MADLVGESLDCLARIYHTENGNVHLEGETYAVTDRALAETLYGIGFVTPVGWTPEPPPDPPILLARKLADADPLGRDRR